MTNNQPKMRKAPKGRSFSSRNPTTIGAIGLMLIAILLWAAFNAQNLPIIGGGTTYHAYLKEAAGIRPDDDVRIAGVNAGKVTGVVLEGDHVNVTFRIKQAYVGDQSQADVKIKTILGAKYLSVNPIGGGKLKPGGVIPLSRTTVPFDVPDTIEGLTDTLGSINQQKLGEAYRVLGEALENTPEQISSTLTGVSALSNSISSRDTQLKSLLKKTADVSGIVASRNDKIAQLITDADLLLDELAKRKQAINKLLENTSYVAAQLGGLASDNQAAIRPALDEFNGVLKMLNNTSDDISRGMQLIAPYLRLMTNVTGNGRWLSGYVRNVKSPGAFGTPNGLEED